MLKSAQNFAAGKLNGARAFKLTAGFFGYPAEESYNLEVMIESPGFNCTLAPWNAVRCDMAIWSVANVLMAVPDQERHLVFHRFCRVGQMGCCLSEGCPEAFEQANEGL